MNKLSVIIITYNEEQNILRCLKSVQWADEIVILDAFSTDGTVSICKQFTKKILQQEWQGYAKQNSGGVGICK